MVFFSVNPVRKKIFKNFDFVLILTRIRQYFTLFSPISVQTLSPIRFFSNTRPKVFKRARRICLKNQNVSGVFTTYEEYVIRHKTEPRRIFFKSPF
jgi:hypothetical protein